MVSSPAPSPWFTRLLDRFGPSRAVTYDERRRLRLVVGLLLLGLLLVPVPAVDHLVHGLVPEGMVLLTSWAALLVMLLGIRHGLSSTLVGHLVSGGLLAQALLNASSLGGIHSPPALSLIVVPAVHMVVVRDRSGWLWTGVFLAAIVLLTTTTAGSAELAREKAIAIAAIMLGLAGAASMFESSRRRGMEELARARKQAEEAAQAKSRFLANMSHEIRTPLNGVLGMLGILRGTRLDSSQREALETARRSGKVLLDLINDILDFSKVEAGHLTIEFAPFELRGLVDEALQEHASAGRAKGLELSAQLVPGTPSYVVGDRGRIRQVLVNLVGNAVKFTAEGHVRVVVAPLEHEGGDSDAVLRFEVRDTGIGIEPPDQGRVFEDFQQVDPSASREQQGTGLGLAIVRELVSRMGGSMGLSSEPGRGSIFWVQLPLRVASDRAVGGLLRDTDASDDSIELSAVGRRVLVVEDNVVNQQVAQRMLERLGAHVEVAGDGEEALAMLQAVPFDLVLMDVQMPGMDGMTATAELRRREVGGASPLPIVAMTAHVLPEDRERCLAAGMDDYVTKPIGRGELRRVLRQHLRAADSVTTPEPSDAEICDLDELRRNYVDDEHELRELAQMFVSRADELLLQMRAALEEGQPDALARHAHALKGISGTVRAWGMFELLQGSPHELASRMDALEQARDRVRALFQRRLGLVESEPARAARV
ncbi:MAG: ATP-binding protein [Nannocystaceae bacterium]